MDSNATPARTREQFIKLTMYRRLVGKLNYLMVIRTNISVVSQLMTSLRDSRWDAIVDILRYIKSAPGKGLHFEDRGHEIIGYFDVGWAG